MYARYEFSELASNPVESGSQRRVDHTSKTIASRDQTKEGSFIYVEVTRIYGKVSDWTEMLKKVSFLTTFLPLMGLLLYGVAMTVFGNFLFQSNTFPHPRVVSVQRTTTILLSFQTKYFSLFDRLKA